MHDRNVWLAVIYICLAEYVPRVPVKQANIHKVSAAVKSINIAIGIV